MELTAAVDQQGRIHVPVQVRRQLGIQPGSNVHLDVHEHMLVVRVESASETCTSCGQLLNGRDT